MAEAQLKFKITNQSLKLLESYIPTEGSENYVHASFELDPDNNLTDAILAVFARYDDKVYIVPKNTETGLYDFELPYLQYPGFYVSCRIFNEKTSRYTEEIFIKVAGNGNTLKRYLKAPDQYSMELLSSISGRMDKLCDEMKELKEQVIINRDKIQVMRLILEEFGKNGRSAFNQLATNITLLDKIPQEDPDPGIELPPEEIDPDPTQGGLIAGDGLFIG